MGRWARPPFKWRRALRGPGQGWFFEIRFNESQRFSRFKVSGGFAGGATPVPIPNTEVKPSRADGTAGETLWESRTPPGLFFPKPPLASRERGFHFFGMSMERDSTAHRGIDVDPSAAGAFDQAEGV